MSLRDKIRGRKKETHTIPFPDGDEVVTIQQMPLRDWIELNEGLEDGALGRAEKVLRIVTRSVYNGDGKPVFTPADHAWMRDDANTVVLRDLFDLACRLNGFVDEESEKNLPASPSSEASTVLPASSESGT